MISIFYSYLFSIILFVLIGYNGIVSTIDNHSAVNRNKIITHELQEIETALYAYLQKNDPNGPNWNTTTAQGIQIPLSNLLLPTDIQQSDLSQYTVYAIQDTSNTQGVFGWVVYNNTQKELSNDDVIAMMENTTKNNSYQSTGVVLDNPTHLNFGTDAVYGTSSPQGYGNIVGYGGQWSGQGLFSSSSFPSWTPIQTHTIMSIVHLTPTTSVNNFPQKHVLYIGENQIQTISFNQVSALKIYLCGSGGAGSGALSISSSYSSSVNFLFGGQAGRNGECKISIYNNPLQPITSCTFNTSPHTLGGSSAINPTNNQTGTTRSYGSTFTCTNGTTTVFSDGANGGESLMQPFAGQTFSSLTNNMILNQDNYLTSSFGFYSSKVNVTNNNFIISVYNNAWYMFLNESTSLVNTSDLDNLYQIQTARFGSSGTPDSEDFPYRMVPVIPAASGYPAINTGTYPFTSTNISAWETILDGTQGTDTMMGYESDIDTSIPSESAALSGGQKSMSGINNTPLTCGQGGAGGSVYSTWLGATYGVGNGQNGAGGCIIVEY